MPIREIRDTSIDQECAKCGNVREIAQSEIEVGVARDNQTNAMIVPLPSCETCGATEYLVRSPDGEEHTASGYGHRHRLLVDLLHARLVKANRVAKELKGKVIPTREPTSAEMEKWFPHGLALPGASVEEG